MDLENLVKTIVHYLLIGGFDLGCWDEFLIVSALVCVIYTKHDLWLHKRKVISCHNSPSYYTTWILNSEKILKLS